MDIMTHMTHTGSVGCGNRKCSGCQSECDVQAGYGGSHTVVSNRGELASSNILRSYSPDLGGSVLFIDEESDMDEDANVNSSGEEEQREDNDILPEATELISTCNQQESLTHHIQPGQVQLTLPDSPLKKRTQQRSFSEGFNSIAQYVRKHSQAQGSSSPISQNGETESQLQTFAFCKHIFFQVMLPALYLLLALVAVVVTYSMITDLIHAMNHPVRSIRYKKVKEHEAPGKVKGQWMTSTR